MNNNLTKANALNLTTDQRITILLNTILYVIPAFEAKGVTVSDARDAFVEICLYPSDDPIKDAMIKYVLAERLKSLKVGDYELPAMESLSVYPPRLIKEVFKIDIF